MFKLPWVYWDACAWIAYINQEKAIQLRDGTIENRFAKCREVLEQANNKKLEIVTSAFTLAEVCKKPEIRESPLDHYPHFSNVRTSLLCRSIWQSGSRHKTCKLVVWLA